VTKVVAQQWTEKVALACVSEDDAARLLFQDGLDCQAKSEGKTTMNMKTKLALGILTALAMLVLTFALPRGGALRDAQLVQFPVTVGVWAIFVLLFVKLK
jgi:hypothetical protein